MASKRLIITLKEIAYEGQSIGTQLDFTFLVGPATTLLIPRIKHGALKQFSKILFDGAITSGSAATPFFLPLFVLVHEEDKLDDFGLGTTLITLTDAKFEHRFEIGIAGDPIGDRGRVALFRFVVAVELQEAPVEDPLTIPPEIMGSVTGCSCINLAGENKSQYAAHPEAERYKWTVRNTKAEIIGPIDQRTITLAGIEPGIAILQVEAATLRGTYTAQIGVHVIESSFKRERDDLKWKGIPLQQPIPRVFINNFELKGRVEIENLAEMTVKGEIIVDGSLSDALGEMKGFRIENGDIFEKVYPVGSDRTTPGFFNDGEFFAQDVIVKGRPGDKNIIRMFGTNTIARVGTETLFVVFNLPGKVEKEFVEKRNVIRAKLKAARTQAEVGRLNKELEDVTEKALLQIKLEFGVLERPYPPDPQVDKLWTYEIVDEQVEATGEVITHPDAIISGLGFGPPLLEPITDPAAFYMIPANYNGAKHKLELGRMLHEEGEPIDLRYELPDAKLPEEAECCAYSVEEVLVRMKPPGFRRIKATDTVSLFAEGTPVELDGKPGTYKWTVLAHPPGAIFEFLPPNPTTKKEIKFKTDTSGVYKFGVVYAVAGVESPHTYDIMDGQIEIRPKLAKKLERIEGKVEGGGGLPRKMLDVPLYKERIGEFQPGAEIKVFGRNDENLGDAITLRALTKSELDFGDELSAKVFFADGAQRNFLLFVDPQNRHIAERLINTIKQIQRILIIGINYHNITDCIGDAVHIFIEATPKFKRVPDIPDASQILEIPDPVGEEDTDDKPLVNLILRNRDLGDAVATNALVGGPPYPVSMNVTNGNFYAAHQLFEAKGIGRAVSAALHYNSINARRAQALRLYGLLNEKPIEQVEKEFGKNEFGDGWTFSSLLELTEVYDRVGPFDNPTYIPCVELLCPDGNRIFYHRVKRKKGDDDNAQGALYGIYNPADTLAGDPAVASSWTISKLAEGEFELADLKGMKIVFKGGRIDHMTDLIIKGSGGQLKPLAFTYQTNQIIISDSTERKTKIDLKNGLAERITAPNKSNWVLKHDRLPGSGAPRILVKQEVIALNTLRDPIEHSWEWDYDGFGHMTLYTPPQGEPHFPHKLRLPYYFHDKFDRVAADVARTFWGRNGGYTIGDRNKVILFDKRQDLQRLAIIDPEGHGWQHLYETDRQACKKTAFIDKEKVAPTASAEDIFGLAFNDLHQYDYQDNTKFVTAYTGLHQDVTNYIPQIIATPAGKKVLLVNEIRYPDKRREKEVYQYNEKMLLKEYTNKRRGKFIYEYYDNNLIKTITYPKYRTHNPPVAPHKQIRLQPIKLFKYDDLGRTLTEELKGSMFSVNPSLPPLEEIQGDKTTFKYINSITGKSGFADEKLIGEESEGEDSKKEALKFSLEWNDMGNRIKETGTAGGETVNTFDKLERLEKTTYPAIRVGNDDQDENNPLQSQVIEYRFNPVGQLFKTVEVVQGAETLVSELFFNSQLEVRHMFLPETNPETFEYDKNGNLTEHHHAQGGITFYKNYDPLGRVRKIIYPEVAEPLADPDSSTGSAKAFTENLHDTVIQYKDQLDEEGLYAKEEKQGPALTIKKYTKGGKIKFEQYILKDTIYGQIKNDYDSKGFLKRIFSGKREGEKFYSQVRYLYNRLGEVIKETARDNLFGHVNSIFPGKGYTAEGAYESVSVGRRGEGSGRQYDKVSRLKKLIDGYGITVQKNIYDPVNRTVEIHRQDPRFESSSQNNLVPVEKQVFNARGGLRQHFQFVDLEKGIELLRQWFDVRNRITQRRQGELTSNHTYDDLNRIKTSQYNSAAAIQNPDGSFDDDRIRPMRTVDYDDLGNTARIEERGVIETRTFDVLGRLKQRFTRGVLKNDALIVDQYFYDALGRMQAIVYGNAHFFETTYNDEAKKIIQTWTKGSQKQKEEQTFLDELNAVETKHITDGHVCFCRYDGFGRIAEETLSRIEPSDKTIFNRLQEFNSKGNPSKTIYFAGGETWRTEYQHNRNNQYVLISGDNFGDREFGDPTVRFDFVYITAGFLIDQHLRKHNHEVHYRYDYRGILAEKSQTFGDDSKFSHILQEKVDEVDFFTGSYKEISSGLLLNARNDAQRFFADIDDEANLLFDEQIRKGSSFLHSQILNSLNPPTKGDVIQTFSYDVNNRLNTEAQISKEIGNDNRTSKSYRYDAKNNLLIDKFESNIDGSALKETHLSFYDSSQTIQKNEITTENLETGELTISTLFYEYDQRSNRTEELEVLEKFNVNRTRQQIWMRSTEYTFNAKDQVKQIANFEMLDLSAAKPGLVGIVATDRINNLYYPDGRLMKMEHEAQFGDGKFFGKDGHEVKIVQLASFKDRKSPIPSELLKIKKKIIGQGKEESTVYHLYHDDSLVALVDGEENFLIQRYLVAAGLNARVATHSLGFKGIPDVKIPTKFGININNLHGNTIELQTEFGESLTKGLLNDDAYGKKAEEALTEAVVRNAVFNTMLPLPISNLFITPARMYDPKTGQWLMPDPQWPFYDPWTMGNGHAFGANNPKMFVDPSGNIALAPLIVPALKYLGVAIATGLVATGVEYAIHQQWGEGEFHTERVLARNIALGLLPGGGIARFGGRFGAGLALKAGGSFGAARLAYHTGGVLATVGTYTAVEYGFEYTPLASGSSFTGILAGNLGGELIGFGLKKYFSVPIYNRSTSANAFIRGWENAPPLRYAFDGSMGGVRGIVSTVDQIQSRAVYAVKEVFAAHQLFGMERHHSVFSYLLRAIAKSGHPSTSQVLQAGQRLPAQRLAALGTKTHQQLHALFDETFENLARREGASDEIAELIRQGVYTPQGIFDILEAFHMRALADYPVERMIVLSNIINIRNRLGIWIFEV